MPPTHSNSRPGETTSCRESLHILNAVEVHGPGCTRGFHPEHDKSSLSDQHNVTVPQQQRPDNDPRVSGHSSRSDHPRQDADSLPSSYRPVGLAPHIAVPVDSGNAASVESFSKIPHTKKLSSEEPISANRFRFCGQPRSRYSHSLWKTAS